MEHIKQNASGLYIEIQKIGCFFRSALLLAEMRCDDALSIEQINSLWNKSKKLGYIDEENNVVDSAKIATLAMRELKNPRTFVEVATFKGGIIGWYRSVKPEDRQIDAYIQKIRQNGPSKYHFRVVDKYGNLKEDPHEPPINVQDICYTICYKLY